jgi:diguanylate cyclase (GGDEF)-like protein
MKHNHRQYKQCCHIILLLSAVEVILAFSCFGFIRITPISFTTMHIPVLIAALAYGRWGGAVLGAVFGILSAVVATNLSFLPGDHAFSPFMSSSPGGSIVTSIGTRILFGWVAGWLYAELKHTSHELWKIGLASFLLTRLHSLLVFTALNIFFPHLAFSPLDSIRRSFTLTSLIETGLAAILIPALYFWLIHMKSGRILRLILSQPYNMLFKKTQISLLLAFCSSLFLTAVALFHHFFNQMHSYLSIMQIELPEAWHAFMLGWEFQFAFALAAVGLILFSIITYYYNLSAKALREARHDSLTGLYNKGSISEQVNAFATKATDRQKAFLMMDIDHFKDINDRFGHPIGDKVLCHVADMLNDITHADAIIGRLGGDEFCIFLPDIDQLPDAVAVIERIFQHSPAIYTPNHTPVTLSIGLVLCSSPSSFNELYAKADQALYAAKARGRNRYSIYKDEDSLAGDR